MDSMSVRTFVSFRYNDINWRSSQAANVGIQAADKFVFNYPGNVFAINTVFGVRSSTIYIYIMKND